MFPAKEVVKFVATRIVTQTRNTLLYAESFKLSEGLWVLLGPTGTT